MIYHDLTPEQRDTVTEVVENLFRRDAGVGWRIHFGDKDDDFPLPTVVDLVVHRLAVVELIVYRLDLRIQVPILPKLAHDRDYLEHYIRREFSTAVANKFCHRPKGEA